MRKNKKAVSLMVSYVILIAIAIGLAIGVYVWLKDYVNIEPKIDCKEGTSMILEDYNCTSNIITLLLKNNGYFNISGFIMHVGNNTERMPIELLSAIGGGFTAGHFDFDSPLGPSDNSIAKFSMEDNIKIIQIQPYIKDEKGNKIMCEQAVIKQNLEDCNYTL